MGTAILEHPPADERSLADELVRLDRDWTEVVSEPARDMLEASLRQWLPSRRWFRGKARTIESVRIQEQIEVPMRGKKALLILFQVAYASGEPELYVLPLACALGREAEGISRDSPQLIVAHVGLEELRQTGVLYDAIVSKDFCRALLSLTATHRTVPGHSGDLESEPTDVLQKIRREQGLDIEPSVSKAEQSNSSIIYKSALILKFFRRLDVGINPELEIERFLSARHFSYSPPLAGALEYHDEHGRPSTVAVITSFIHGCHDAWEDTIEALREFYQRAARLPPLTPDAASLFGGRGIHAASAPPAIWPSKLAETGAANANSGTARPGATLLLENVAPSRKLQELVGAYLQDAATLGRRTAALHLTLASDADDPAFAPEPWTPAAQQSLCASLQELTRHNCQLLRQHFDTLPADTRTVAGEVLSLESALGSRLRQMAEQPARALRIRTHGDYHLGQVLHRDSDFLIIDFEGEPAVSLEERRAKQSALRDVAGMIHSFFYAANAALRELPVNDGLFGWGRCWSETVSATFLGAYRETAGAAPFVPLDEIEFRAMLDAELLRKSVYELGYELNNRPEWLAISLRVLLDLFNDESEP